MQPALLLECFLKNQRGYITFQQNQQMMNRNINTSYEGFRRKNCLKSEQVTGLSSSTQLSLMRIKSKDHLEEIQNLSSQLNDFRQRSLSCNNYDDDISHSSNFGQVKQSQSSGSKNKINFNTVPELSTQFRSLKDVERMSSPTLKKGNSKNQKINGFNEFHIIQEDHNSNEDEILDIIAPVTMTQTPPTSKGTDKKHLIKTNDIKNYQNYHKPLISHKTDNANLKKDKLKQDINDIQKMQKQLDHHIKKKEPAIKSSMNARSTKEIFQRESNIKQEQSKQYNRSNQLGTNLLHNKTALESKNNRATLKNKTQIEEKGDMNKLMTIDKNIEKQKNETQASEQKQEMIATKMITIKEKQTLIDQLLALKEIIDKNQICSNNLVQINANLSNIQELLTR